MTVPSAHLRFEANWIQILPSIPLLLTASASYCDYDIVHRHLDVRSNLLVMEQWVWGATKEAKFLL